jgi:hypothetical protein
MTQRVSILLIATVLALVANVFMYIVTHLNASNVQLRHDNAACLATVSQLSDSASELQLQLTQTRQAAARQLSTVRDAVDALEKRIADVERKSVVVLARSEASTTTTRTTTTATTSTTSTLPPSSTTTVTTVPLSTDWHPWDRVPPPPEARIMARRHWREEERPPADYPYDFDEAYAAHERRELLAAEQTYMRAFVDPYTLYRKRALRDRRFLRLSPTFAFDTPEAEMRAQSDAIQRHLAQLQNPARCDASLRYVLFSFSTFQSYGFGAAVRHLAMAFDYALSRRRVLVVQEVDQFSYADAHQTPLSAADAAKLQSTGGGGGRSSFGFAGEAPAGEAPGGGGECGGGWQCYFDAPSTCTRESLIEARLPMRATILFEQSRYEQISQYSARGRTYDEVLLQLGDDRLHDLYWRAQLLRFLFKPVAVLRARLAQWRAPPIAVHIRQGDKAGELSGRAVSVTTYHDAVVRQLQARNATTRSAVFVASDAAAALDELRALAGERYELVQLVEERHSDAMQLLLREHAVDRKREAVAALSNMWLLAQSDTLVGYAWSKFCALAFELQYARDDQRTDLVDVLGGTWTPF